MAPKFLKDLTDKSRQFSVKVKIIEKARPQVSPSKVKYQKILMQDDKGGLMGATIYNDDITAYAQAIKCRKEYEISDGLVKPIRKGYQEGTESYEMVFTNRTIIRPLFAETSDPDIPEYVVISEIDRTPHCVERYDVLGVVIYLEPLRTIHVADANNQKGREVSIREVAIVDHSCKGKETLTVSIWNDLATEGCEELSTILDSFPVIGMTSLKGSHYAGFSLASTRSTFIYMDPPGQKAQELALWAHENTDLLSSLKDDVEGARKSRSKAVLRSIAEFKTMKGSNTAQGQCIWICGSIPNLDQNLIRLYLGCDKCGTKSNKDIGTKYNCSNSRCQSIATISSARMTFAFDLVDISGSWNMTLFSDEAGKVLGIEPEALYNMENQVWRWARNVLASLRHNQEFWGFLESQNTFSGVLTMRTENLKVHDDRRQLFSSNVSKESTTNNDVLCIHYHFGYKERFFAYLTPSRRGGTDFTRPVFMAVAFYLCAKKHKVCHRTEKSLQEV